MKLGLRIKYTTTTTYPAESHKWGLGHRPYHCLIEIERAFWKTLVSKINPKSCVCKNSNMINYVTSPNCNTKKYLDLTLFFKKRKKSISINLNLYEGCCINTCFSFFANPPKELPQQEVKSPDSFGFSFTFLAFSFQVYHWSFAKEEDDTNLTNSTNAFEESLWFRKQRQIFTEIHASENVMTSVIS